MAKRKIDFTLRDYWNQDSLLVYKEAVSRYPYCAPARVSFLLNLKALDDPDYERELPFTALAVPDRQRLQEEVRAVEEAAAVARERGERRMRQATARWVAASATTAALGRLMSAHATAPASEADGEVSAEGAGVPMQDREVDFRAVAANEPAAVVRAAASTEAVAAEETPAAASNPPMDRADEPARSRSARRNARRLVRQWAMEHAASAAPGKAEAMAPAEPETAEETAAFQTISSMWAAESESDPKPVAPAVSPQRPRKEAFNPWAEVFTAKHTISDWLQSEGEEPASTSAEPQATAAAVSPRRVTQKTAKSTKSTKSAAKTAAKPKATAKSAAKPQTSAKPATAKKRASARAASGYIDPNELIDRFLRQNDDHILIQVDETRDYSTFDPDRSSLREDWSMGSETLAQLYLKQGAPDKAIEIYRYLSLKFPEKNRYFASLIRAAESAKRGQ